MLTLGKLKKPMLVIAMREPYELRYLPKHAAGIAAWEYSTRSIAALGHCLSGDFEFTGVCRWHISLSKELIHNFCYIELLFLYKGYSAWYNMPNRAARAEEPGCK